MILEPICGIASTLLLDDAVDHARLPPAALGFGDPEALYRDNSLSILKRGSQAREDRLKLSVLAA